MSLAANAPHAFALMHIDTNGVRAQRFARMERAFKAATKLGGTEDGPDYTVVGLDAKGAAYEVEVYPHTDRSNPTGYRLTRLIGKVITRKAAKRSRAA